MTIWKPTLDRTKPLYLAIADAMAADVERGVLADGAQLPPQRDLAWDLGVTLGTVTRGYREAELRGLLVGEVGRGSFVRGRNPILSPELAEAVINLNVATPPPVLSKTELDHALLSLTRAPNRLSLLSYQQADDMLQHRIIGRDWLRRSGIEVHEDDVFLTGGGQLGVHIALQSLLRAGGVVMAERINFASLKSIFEAIDVQLHPLDTGETGSLVMAFERAASLGQSRVLYLCPSCQNPTTRRLSLEEREAIVAIARKQDVTIIEDDVFRLLDERPQPPTFYALAPERVVHVTSLSKALAPGLRLGLVVPPRENAQRLRSNLRLLSSRNMAAELACYWIENGECDAILKRIRLELTARRTAFLEVFSGFKVQCDEAAPFAWLELPKGLSGKQLASSLRMHRIAITPGTTFDISGSGQGEHHVRICFGGPSLSWQPRQTFKTIRDVIDAGQVEETEDFMPVA